jgi:hypothetical protein
MPDPIIKRPLDGKPGNWPIDPGVEPSHAKHWDNVDGTPPRPGPSGVDRQKEIMASWKERREPPKPAKLTHGQGSEMDGYAD